MRWGGGVIDGDLWWAGTNVTTVVGSGVIGKQFAANHYDYGYMYTWNYITENGRNRIGIICPDGWRLPTTNEQVALTKASGFPSVGVGSSINSSAGSATVNGINGYWLGPGVANNAGNYTTATHIFIPFAGRNTSGSSAVGSVGIGSYAHLWSSTPYGSSIAYFLYLRSSFIEPQHDNPRTNGLSVRCVADAL